MIKQKKNILIIAYNDLNNSGVPNVIYQIIKAQHETYNFDILIFDKNLYYYSKLKNEGVNSVNIIECNVKKPTNFFKKLLFYIFKKNNIYYRNALHILKSKKYYAIHSFKEFDGGPFLKAAKKVGIDKRIVHTTVIHNKSRNILLNSGRRQTLKYGTIFVGVTELACQYAFPEKNFKVIHFSYDESKFNMEIKSKLNDDQLVLTQVATYSTNKNQLFSIEIMKFLRLLHRNVKLKLIGKESEPGYQRKIEEEIKKGGLQNEVEIIDGSKGVGDNLEYTSYCLLTSLKEGASLVVVESQACGIAVFASSIVSKEMNVGGIQYLNLKNGAQFWAEKIYAFFIKNKNNRIKYDLSSFSKENFANEIGALYHN